MAREHDEREPTRWIEHMAVEPAELLYSLKVEHTSRLVLAWIFIFYAVCTLIAMVRIPDTEPAFYELMEFVTAVFLFLFAAGAYWLARRAKAHLQQVEARLRSPQR
ncbi:MAG: hypothetical protein HY347_07740 [candidate division NC10 bacterium]|nr:hypothetical protein [candidate division NC10 bacterium]